MDITVSYFLLECRARLIQNAGNKVLHSKHTDLRIKVFFLSAAVTLYCDVCVCFNRPSVLDNFALLSGQLNTINKLLKNEKTPSFRHQVIIPLLLSPDRDEDLAVSIRVSCLLPLLSDLSFNLVSLPPTPTETHRAARPGVQPRNRPWLPADQTWSRGGGAGEAAECRGGADWPRGGAGEMVFV